MTFWTVKGSELALDVVGAMEPETILYDFEGPRTFTFRDRDGFLALAHWCDEDEVHARFLAVPFSESLLGRLRAGELSVREALDQPVLWVVDRAHDGTVREVRRTSLEGCPEEVLPAPGTMLLAALEPVLTLRATGEAIQPGSVPASVIRWMVDGVQKAIQRLVEHVAPNQEFSRRLCDLRTQRIAYGSIEVSFRLPAGEGTGPAGEADPLASVERAGRLLARGLLWTATEPGATDPEAVEGDPPGTPLVILDALLQLSPSAQSHVETLEVRGRWTAEAGGATRLTRGTRERIRLHLGQREARRETVVEMTGRIRAFDLDRMNFELREIPGEAGTRKFTVDEDLVDAVIDFARAETRVTVTGLRSPSGAMEAKLMVEAAPD